MRRGAILSWLHERMRPDLYVEIGIREGESLRYALPGTKVVAIDPEPQISYRRPLGARVFEETSDAFFDRPDVDAILGGPVSFGFIDGMHLFEYSLRDFMNLERRSTPGSLILLDDTYPKSAEEASRELRQHGPWAGDVWRTVCALRRLRPDLHLVTLDVGPTGLTAVSNVDPTSDVLARSWDAVTEELAALAFDADDLRAVLDPVAPELAVLEALVPVAGHGFPPGPVALAGRALRPPHPDVFARWTERQWARVRRRR